MLGLKRGEGAGAKWLNALGPIALLVLAACGSETSGPGPGANTGATSPSGGGSSGLGGTTNGGAGGSGGLTPSVGSQVKLMTVRRLNRIEYANTLRDLTGTTTDHGASFPPENLSFGFDNIGEALTVQPLHVELYEKSADAVLDELFARPASDPLRTRFLSCDPNTGGRACVSSMLVKLAQYAYRRTVAEAEIIGLVDIAEEFVSTGGLLDDGLKLAFKGVLLSPHFLYRVELDPDPTSNVPHRLGGFELASRLSYYLWSTMPDDVLLGEAQSGALTGDAALAAQVERMLADPRAKALVSNFVGQWLNLRRIEQVAPDLTTFPGFDEELRASLRSESELFFGELLAQNRPVSELLTGAFSYVNKKLATHYGLQPPAGDGFVRVDLTGTQRVGFLTQGSFLTLTSNPTRTSPVKRGKWVLDQLLCSPPPPPPPGVDTSLADTGATISLRARLEAHRAKPACAGCHTVMDPIGLAFENFDGVGTYRVSDQFGTIDATGTLPTANGPVSFLGARELMPVLSTDERLASCVAEKVLTYAVGHGFTPDDTDILGSVVAAADASGKGLRGLFASVATSEPFRSRKAVGP